MAVSATPAPAPQTAVEKTVTTSLGLGAQAYLARLSTLHDEAAETAHLANLLGRTPWVAGVLGTASLATIIISLRSMPSAPLGVWLASMAIAIAVTARVYGRAVAQPFDRESLKEFARNFSAILMFTGAVWGAGVTLALPAGASIAASIFYLAGTSAAMAAILRVRDLGFCFLVPATVVGAICVLMRNFDGAAAAGVLGGGVAAAGAAVLIERFSGIGFGMRQE